MPRFICRQKFRVTAPGADPPDAETLNLKKEIKMKRLLIAIGLSIMITIKYYRYVKNKMKLYEI